MSGLLYCVPISEVPLYTSTCIASLRSVDANDAIYCIIFMLITIFVVGVLFVPSCMWS